MDITLNKNNGKPLYKQLYDQVSELIRKRELEAGYRMPAERDLSLELGVSRNTVSSAYRELEASGLLTSRQGKGTFVSDDAAGYGRDIYLNLHRLLDQAIDEAAALGVDDKSLSVMLDDRIKARANGLSGARSVFLECNIEQAKFFARELTELTRIPCQPLTISDLETMDDDTARKLREASVVIATFNHVREVVDLVGSFGKEVLGIAINPDLETIVRIARYPDSKRFGFLCISDQFMQKTRQALESAGLGYLSIEFSNTKDEDEVKRLVEDSEVLIVSPGRVKDIEKYNIDGKEIIEFQYNLDEGSVKALKSKLIEQSLM